MDSGGTTLSVLRALPQVKLVGVEGVGGVRVNSGGTTLSVLRALPQVKLVGVGEGG